MSICRPKFKAGEKHWRAEVTYNTVLNWFNLFYYWKTHFYAFHNTFWLYCYPQRGRFNKSVPCENWSLQTHNLTASIANLYSLIMINRRDSSDIWYADEVRQGGWPHRRIKLTFSIRSPNTCQFYGAVQIFLHFHFLCHSPAQTTLQTAHNHPSCAV